MNDQYKIQLIVEALNKFQGTFNDLKKQLGDVDGNTKKLQASSKGMLDGMKANWLAVSAAVVAAGAAIATALEYMDLGAKAEQAEESFRAVAAAAGESADEIIAAMRRAAAGTVDDSDIMQKAVKGMMQGLSGSQLVSIMEAARTAARVTGQEVGQAYETITDAIANKAPRALLQYGLITKEQMKMLNEAMAMGITEVDLYAIAMENASNQTAKLNIEGQNNIEKLQQWKAMFNDVKENIGKGVFWIMDNVIDPLVSTIQKAGAMIGHTFSTIGVIWDWLTSGFKGGVSKLNDEFKRLDNDLRDQFREIDAKHGGRSGSTPGPSGRSVPSSGERGATAALEGILAMKAREVEIQKQITSLDIAEKNREVSRTDAARERLRLTEQLLSAQTKNLNLLNDPNARAGKQKEIDETLKKIAELKLALQELTGTFETGFNEGLTRYVESVGSTFKQAVKLAQETAQAMEQAFSDLFFDAMTGKLKHFSDYIKSFLLSVARAIANMMGQQAAAGIASSIGSAFGSGTSGVSAGASAGASAGVSIKHKGGLVMHEGGYVPRFHFGGLMPDERPAILQTGEGVLSRKGMAALDALNSGNAGGMSIVVQVENKSSQPVKATQGATQIDGKRIITGVILEDLEYGGPIRTAIAGVK